MLRVATVSDIPEIQRIRHSVRENRLVTTVIRDADVREAIENRGRGWVVELGGRLVGFSIGDAKTGNIWALFVHPDHEGRGFGRQLHDAMLVWLWSQGLDRLWLTTEPQTRAQPLVATYDPRYQISPGLAGTRGSTRRLHADETWAKRVTAFGEMESPPRTVRPG